MEWLGENWFWALIFILFIGMHLFGHGHGGHGSHGGHNHNDHDSEHHNKKGKHNHRGGCH